MCWWTSDEARGVRGCARVIVSLQPGRHAGRPASVGPVWRRKLRLRLGSALQVATSLPSTYCNRAQR